MLSLSRLRTLMLGCALLVSLIAAGSSRGQDAGSNDVSFKTFDGVTLSGKLYAGAPAARRTPPSCSSPTSDLTKGGGMQQEGYDDLAKALQKEGYTVLSFDFRGFGDSKAVDPVNFWKYPHNMSTGSRKPKVVGGKSPSRSTTRTSPAKYAEYFVNDIAAAKAFLDAENDGKNCNTSNLIVIGAGYGATLGAMWVANECRRRRDNSVLPGRHPPCSATWSPTASSGPSGCRSRPRCRAGKQFP